MQHRVTITELRIIFRASWLMIDGVVKLITRAGLGKRADYLPVGGKGRPHIVYELPEQVIINLKTGEITCYETTSNLP